MLVSDLLHSCANDRVAAAAVSSIGGMVASGVQVKADRDGLTIGAYVAQAVQTFAATASERDWRDLISALHGHDHPLLAGLQQILERQDGRARLARYPVGANLAISTASLAAA